MSLKQKAEQEGDEKLTRLLRTDGQIRRAAKLFWQQSRQDSEVFPFPHLLLVSVRLDALSTRLSALVNQIIYLDKLRESNAYSPATVQQKIRKWKKDPFVQAHLNNISDNPEDSGPPDERSLLREIEEQISRDAALSVAWWSSVRVSWRSALTGTDMPTFEPSDVRKEEVEHIFDEARQTRFWKTAEDLEVLGEEADRPSLLPITKVLGRHYRQHFRKLKEKHPRQASSEQERFIRHAERSKRELENKGRQLIETLLDRHNARVLSELHNEFSLDSRALSKLLATDFGSDAVVDIGIDEKQEIRSSLRENMESLFLSLGCFIDVREALNDTGDPKRARETIAPVTDRIASDKQAQHLETAHDALQSNPGLRTDPKVQWESKLTGGVTGNTVIRGVERLAKDCYGVEKKEKLPDEYLRFESGGFANLVEDLFHGSWEG